MIFKEYLIETFGINEPIYIEDIKYGDYSRTWIFTELKKLVESQVLIRFDRGIYYFPKKSAWREGYSILDPEKVMKRKYITNGNDIYGYIAGLSLWNQSGLSTQVPNLVEIATNNEKAVVHDVLIGGYKKVRTRKSRTTVTKDNVNTLQFLDLMNIMQPPAHLDEAEKFMLDRFIKYLKKKGVTKDSLIHYSKYFPARAKNNLFESGAVYEFV
jgi:hypothetical protein